MEQMNVAICYAIVQFKPEANRIVSKFMEVGEMLKSMGNLGKTTEFKTRFGDVDFVIKKANALMADSPDMQVKYIAPDKPRFLILSSSELISFANIFSNTLSQTTVSPAILGLFLPGVRQIEFDGEIDGQTLSVSKLVANHGEKIEYKTKVELNNQSIWTLPQELYKANFTFLQKQLDITISSLKGSETFFHWFFTLLLQYHTTDDYPIQTQILYAFIRIWYSKEVSKIAESLGNENFVEMTTIIFNLQNNIFFTLSLLMTIQRIRAPIGSNRASVKQMKGEPKYDLNLIIIHCANDES
jgi:hypothetical protein